tara:strand:- start:152 stop:337 length:186 start_codon:yes stop_codon:yes gene_type:complete
MGMNLWIATAKMNSSCGKIKKGDTFNISISGSKQPGYNELKKVTPSGAGYTSQLFEIKKMS